MSSVKLWAGTFVALLATASSLAQEGSTCDSCPKPVIGLYDFQVTVPRPAGERDIIDWLRLFWPARGARNYFVDRDPSRNCAIFLDGAMSNAAATDGTLRFGQETVNLPPGGALKAIDYIVSGTVSQSAGVNTASLTIQASVSRELVTTGTATFAIREGSDDPLQAGRTAAMQASPIVEVIRKWEKKKRDSDKNVAIGQMLEIKVEPEKKRISPGETINVDITMKDCDDVPLAGREIAFDETEFEGMRIAGTTGGKVKPTTVTTDGGGRAKVTFTADKKQGGPMVIVAHWIHKTPSGHNDASLGQAALNPNGYLVEVEKWLERSCDWRNPPGTSYEQLKMRVREEGRFRFIWIPKGVDEDYTVRMTDDEEDGTIAAPSVFASRTDFLDHEKKGEDNFYSHLREQRSGRKTDAADINFLFTLRPGEWSFILGVEVPEKRTFTVVSMLFGKWHSENKVTDESDGVSVTATSNDPPGETQIRETKSGWIITGKVNKKTRNPEGPGELVERSSFIARVTRLSDR